MRAAFPLVAAVAASVIHPVAAASTAASLADVSLAVSDYSVTFDVLH